MGFDGVVVIIWIVFGVEYYALFGFWYFGLGFYLGCFGFVLLYKSLVDFDCFVCSGCLMMTVAFMFISVVMLLGCLLLC